MAFPYLSDLVRTLTGLDLPLPVPMFGLMVAVAFLVSVPLAAREVRRLHEAGRIAPAGSRRVRRRSSRPDARIRSRQDRLSDLRRRGLGHSGRHGAQARLASRLVVGPDLR